MMLALPELPHPGTRTGAKPGSLDLDAWRWLPFRGGLSRITEANGRLPGQVVALPCPPVALSSARRPKLVRRTMRRGVRGAGTVGNTGGM